MTSITTPSDVYYKSRRNLAFFGGILLLDNFAGINHNPKDISFFPFTFENTELISPVLLTLFIYSIWQYWTAWYTQSPEVREYKIHRWDCMVLGFISSISFVVFWIPPMWSIFPFYLNPIFQFNAFWMLAFFRATVILENVERKAVIEKENTITNILLNGNWILNFNPASEKGYKQIGFVDNGDIAEGKNNNEDRWRIKEGILEILNSEARVFSRFRYNKISNSFEHTNEDDTISIRNQRIIPISDYLWILKSQGIKLRDKRINKNIEGDYLTWKADFDPWYEQVLACVSKESITLFNKINTPDTNLISLPINTVRSKEHRSELIKVYWTLQCLETYLNKTI